MVLVGTKAGFIGFAVFKLSVGFSERPSGAGIGFPILRSLTRRQFVGSGTSGWENRGGSTGGGRGCGGRIAIGRHVRRSRFVGLIGSVSLFVSRGCSWVTLQCRLCLLQGDEMPTSSMFSTLLICIDRSSPSPFPSSLKQPKTPRLVSSLNNGIETVVDHENLQLPLASMPMSCK